MSYTSLLSIVCLANLLQFILRPRIYIHEKKSQLYGESKPVDPPVGKSVFGLGAVLNGIKKKEAEDGKKDMGKKDMG